MCRASGSAIERRKQAFDVQLGEPAGRLRRIAEERAGEAGLAALEQEHALLDAAGRVELVDEHRLRLADAVGAVGRLRLARRVPPWIVVDDGVRRDEVETRAA